MKNLSVALCLDESGSMGANTALVIDSINEYVTSIPKSSLLTLTMFSDMGAQERTCRTYAENIKPADFKPLNLDSYRPRGNTPLYDAIAVCASKLGRKKNVLFVIQTDGYENASRDVTRAQVVKLLADKENFGWKIIFLGADMTQAQAEALSGSLGLSAGQTMSYYAASTDSAFRGLSTATATASTHPHYSSVILTNTTKTVYEDEEEKKKEKN